MDAARELAQLLESGGELLACGLDDRLGRRRGRVFVRDSARRSETESATSRCWAPSWRFRSSTRRASSAASMMRVREARISSSCLRRSVTSFPERSTSDGSRPVTSATGVAVHEKTICSPSARPARLALAARDAVRRRGDRHAREVAVVGVDQLEHARPDDVLVGPAERGPERLVHGGAVARRRRCRRSSPPGRRRRRCSGSPASACS